MCLSNTASSLHSHVTTARCHLIGYLVNDPKQLLGLSCFQVPHAQVCALPSATLKNLCVRVEVQQWILWSV